MRLCLVIVSSIVFLASCDNQLKGQENQNANGSDQVIAAQKTGEKFKDLQELLVDLVAYSGCDHIDRIMLLSPEGAETTGQSGTVSGILWIRDCQIEKLDPTNIQVDISGIGWRWVEREITKAGATFALDQNVRFEMSLSTVGTFDMVYSPKEKLITVWFVPTREVEATFTIRGAIDVDTESLWDSIIGQAAKITGKTPQQRAVERIRKVGTRTIQTKLDQGFTIVMDLCTGQQYMKFGKLEAGRLPKKAAAQDDRSYELETAVNLHYKSIIMAGPFEKGKYIADFYDVDNGSFEALWVCRDEAERIAHKYVNGENITKVDAIRREVVHEGEKVTFEFSVDTECPLVLLTRPFPDASLSVTFQCQIYSSEQEKGKQLVDCE